MRRTLVKLITVSALACAAGFVATAPRADILDDVRTAKTVRVAIVTDYPPFGFVGPTMKPEGYDIEVASLIARRLNVALELVPVTSANKIPYIQSKRADVLLNIGRTEERAKVVDFADPYAPYYIGVFGPAQVTVEKIEDLAGKSIAATRGSFEELILSRSAPPGTDIRRFEDNAATIAAFTSGQTELLGIGNIVAAALRDRKPARMPDQKLLLLNSPVRAAVLKGEAALLAEVNAAIAGAKADGTLARMSQSWLKQPFPQDL